MNVAVPAQMFKLPARTIRRAAVVRGRGLHGGRPAVVRLFPEPAGTGIRLVSGTVRLRLCPAHGRAARGCSWWGPVRTVEHFLAALQIAGITDLTVDVEGEELPGLDGSAAMWLEAVEPTVVTGETWGYTLGWARVARGGGWAWSEPAQRLVLDVSIVFPGLHQRRITMDLREVADARTFALHASLPGLRAAGRGRGLGPGRAVVWGPRGSLVPLRHADEPVRHKILDLLGDLAFVGGPVRGRVRVCRGSHRLHLELVRACGRWRSRCG